MMSSTEGQVIRCRAALLWKEGSPVTVEEITVDPPKAGEARVKMASAGVCASDAHFVWGWDTDVTLDFEGHPVVMGHEGAGVVESIGEGVTSVQPGDHVIVLWMPQCNTCPLCVNPRTNLCATQSIFTTLYHNNETKETRMKINGKPLLSLCGTSTFSEYSVIREIQLAKINPAANLNNVSIISCAVGTGYGSAMNIAKVQPGSSCAVWGLGAIGLSTLLGCKLAGATNIIGVDINPDKEDIAKKMGATRFINPNTLDEPIYTVLLKEGGVEFTFDCIGNKAVLEAAHKSLTPWGALTVVGLGPRGNSVETTCKELVMGRRIGGGLFGNQKSRETNQKLVEMYLCGELQIDDIITHRISLDQINEAFDTLKAGKTIRTVIQY